MGEGMEMQGVNGKWEAEANHTDWHSKKKDDPPPHCNDGKEKLL